MTPKTKGNGTWKRTGNGKGFLLMSKNKETGEWSQGKGKPYSFKLKDEYHDLFINLHQTLETWNGEPLTKTQVFEWMLVVSAKEVHKAEEQALKHHRMELPEP